MPKEKPSTLNSVLDVPDQAGLQSEESAQNASSSQQTVGTAIAEKGKHLLTNHKGKLAVGAAAMLGLAVFYKWRESKLAKEDPEEYALLQRLKAAVENDTSELNKKQAQQNKVVRNEDPAKD